MSCAFLLVETRCTFLIAVTRTWLTEPSCAFNHIFTTSSLLYKLPRDRERSTMCALPDPKDFEDDGKNAANDDLAGFEAEAAGKPGGNKLEGSLSVRRGSIRVPSPDPSLLSIDDSNNIRYGRNPDYLPESHGRRNASRSPAPPRTAKGKLQALWYKNKGLFLVLISQFFGTLMNITTRLLEMEGNDGRRSKSVSWRID